MYTHGDGVPSPAHMLEGDRTASQHIVTNMRKNIEDKDFQHIFETCPGLYLVLYPDFTIAAVSDAYLHATMTQRKDIIGRGIFDVFPDNPSDIHADGVSNLRASLERALRERRADTMPIQRYDIRREDGSFEERFWSPLNTPVVDGSGQVRFIIHRVEDVTAYVRLQNTERTRREQVDDLRSQTVRMEAEIFARSQDLARVNGDLRLAHAAISKAQAEKDLLTGMIIHDLRNPLAACLGHVEMAMDKAAPADASLARHLDGARKAGLHLQTMIDGIIDIIRMEDGRMPVALADVDIKQIIDAKIIQYQGAAARSHIVVTHDTTGTALRHVTDATLLGRIIDNLLTNAIKHTPPGGSVTIRDSCTASGHAIRIIDTGEGIAAEDIPRLFQKYGRIDGQARGRENDTGLGLVFCRMAMDLLGGSISVESALGHGCTFILDLPNRAG